MQKSRPNENNVRQGQTIHVVVIDNGRQMPLKDSYVMSHFVSSQKASPEVDDSGLPISIPVNFLKNYLKLEGNRYVFYKRNQAEKTLERHLDKIRSEMWINEMEAILKHFNFEVGDCFGWTDHKLNCLTVTEIKFTSGGIIVEFDMDGEISNVPLVEFTRWLKANGALDEVKADANVIH